MAPDPVERWRDLGSFIREQRSGARLSLRRLSELAGISNPYLSQIERGLRRPSADILQQIAKALRISAETLYVQAGILDPPTGGTDLVAHIRTDPHLTESQKQALVQIYRSFRAESAEAAPSAEAGAGSAEAAQSADAGAQSADAAARSADERAGSGSEAVSPETSEKAEKTAVGARGATPDGAPGSAH